ncbi:MAG: hypothetical protein ACKO23_06230, partial [Gemmataceae bacterium]
VKGHPYQVREIEFYLHQPGHLDPFTHGHSRQQTAGQWYFHRIGTGFRSGTYKGLDLTIGGTHAHGGILLRSLEKSDGTLIEGPSRVVDWLLEQTDISGVADLASRAEKLPADDPGNTLRFTFTDPCPGGEMLATARVGLAPKKVGDQNEMLRFLLKPYRFLSEAARTRKGRPQIVLALLLRGWSPEAIDARLGTPLRVIRNYLEAMKRGSANYQLQPLPGRPPTGIILAEWFGWASANCPVPQ